MLGDGKRAEGADLRVVSVVAVVVEAVADDEGVGDLEPDVIRFDFDDALDVLAQQNAEADAGRVLREDGLAHEVERLPGVEDVIDHDNVLARQIAREFAGQACPARDDGLPRVARDGDQFEAEFDRHLAHEVGGEDHRPGHDRYEHNAALDGAFFAGGDGCQIGSDRAGHLAHAAGDAVPINEDLFDLNEHGGSLTCSWGGVLDAVVQRKFTVVDARFLEDLAHDGPAEPFVEPDGRQLRVAEDFFEAQLPEGVRLDGDDELAADAFALALRIDGDLHDLSLLGARIVGAQQGAPDDAGTRRVIDDGHEVREGFFHAGVLASEAGHVVPDGLEEHLVAQVALLGVEGVIQCDAFDAGQDESPVAVHADRLQWGRVYERPRRAGGWSMGIRLHADDDFLCGRCGYVLNGLARDSVCPECGRPIEASHPDARRGTPWQRGERFGYWKTLFMALARPRRMFDVCRIEAASVQLLMWLHFSLAAAVMGGAHVMAAMMWGRQHVAEILLVAVVLLMPGVWLLLFLLTEIERRGIMLWGRAGGRRINAQVASTIVAHASAGWVAASVLVFAGTWLGADLFWLYERRAGFTTYDLYVAPAIGPGVGAFLGLLWFEMLVYIGVRRCGFANAPAAAARLTAVDDRTRGDASLH